MIHSNILTFLKELHANNNKEWFTANKNSFQNAQKYFKEFIQEIENQLIRIDHIEKTHVFRIYRDVRFSKDKTPYKQNFGVSFSRKKPLLRGGYYLHIEPNQSFVACGFWAPEKDDLQRIRKEIEFNDQALLKILNEKKFIQTFGKLSGASLIKAPKGFDPDHPSISLIKMKQFYARKKFSDAEICSPNFLSEILSAYICIRPFFDYMSDALCTDLNGEPLYSFSV